MHVVARIDLVKVATSLRHSGKHAEAVKAIDRAAAAGTIRDDLLGAQAALAHIVKLQDRAQSEPTSSGEEEGMLTGALFNQAVILYARATTTKGNRSKLIGEAKLTTEQRATHDEAMTMRDEAVAHFGRAEWLIEGPMVREAVVLTLVRTDTGLKRRVDVYTARALHKVAFAARLADLVEIRLSELAARYLKLFDAADAAIHAAVAADSDLGRSLPGFEFDVDGFCASSSTAARMRAQLEAGLVEDTNYAVLVPRP